MPFWSADSLRIGFFTNDQLRVFDLAAGQPADLTAVSSGRGGTWTSAGDVVFATANAGLTKRDVNGAVATLTSLDSANGETAHGWPSFLPDGRHVIFVVNASQPSRAGIWIASLDDPSQRRRLLASNGQAASAG